MSLIWYYSQIIHILPIFDQSKDKKSNSRPLLIHITWVFETPQNLSQITCQSTLIRLGLPTWQNRYWKPWLISKFVIKWNNHLPDKDKTLKMNRRQNILNDTADLQIGNFGRHVKVILIHLLFIAYSFFYIAGIFRGHLCQPKVES